MAIATRKEEKKLMPRKATANMWTEEQINTLKEMYGTLVEVDEIARVIGRTKKAIWLKASKLGLKRYHV